MLSYDLIRRLDGNDYITAFSPVSSGDYDCGLLFDIGRGHWWTAISQNRLGRYVSRPPHENSALVQQTRAQKLGGYSNPSYNHPRIPPYGIIYQMIKMDKIIPGDEAIGTDESGKKFFSGMLFRAKL